MGQAGVGWASIDWHLVAGCRLLQWCKLQPAEGGHPALQMGHTALPAAGGCSPGALIGSHYFGNIGQQDHYLQKFVENLDVCWKPILLQKAIIPKSTEFNLKI